MTVSSLMEASLALGEVVGDDDESADEVKDDNVEKEETDTEKHPKIANRSTGSIGYEPVFANHGVGKIWAH